MFKKSNVLALVWLLVVGWVFPANVVVADHLTPDAIAPQPLHADPSSSLRGNQRQLKEEEEENPYDFKNLAAVQNSSSSSFNSTGKYAGPETPNEINQGKTSSTSTSSSSSSSKTSTAAESPSSTRFESPQPATIVNQTQQSQVVDSVDSFLLDPNATTSAMFPPETETPSYWPMVVFGVFLTVAVALCTTTGWKYHKRTSSYTPIPN